MLFQFTKLVKHTIENKTELLVNIKANHLSLFITVLLFLAFTPQESNAQLEDALEDLTGELGQGYLEPLANSIMNGINCGQYRTAHVGRLGLNIYVGLASGIALLSDDDKTFMAKPPEPFSQEEVETATVFGGKGAVAEGPSGLEYAFQSGQLEGDYLPLAAPHIEVGDLFGTRLKIRWFSAKMPGDLPEEINKIEMFGFGLQHSISQWLPLFPVDVSVGFFTQSFELGTLLKTDAFSYGVQVSKTFSVLTVYGGLGMDNSTLEANYTFSASGIEEDISLEFENNQIRFMVGSRLKLGTLSINGDVSMGGQTTVSLGFGFGG